MLFLYSKYNPHQGQRPGYSLRSIFRPNNGITMLKLSLIVKNSTGYFVCTYYLMQTKNQAKNINNLFSKFMKNSMHRGRRFQEICPAFICITKKADGKPKN